jgi:putative DNA methylase
MRTEMASRTIGRGTNSLASSIVLACRPRPADAPTTSRNAFLRELRRELPRKLRTMQQASIAPVDLAQAAIGPGMAIYSAYSQVSEPNGDRLKVRAALQLINQVLDEVLTEQDSEHDRETGWAVAWFEQFGMNEAEYGRADTLATARAVSVDGLRDAGLIRAGRGRVQLIKRADLVLPPELGGRGGSRDKRLTDWEIAQYLIRALDTGRAEAAALKLRIGSRAEIAKDLAYRLYTICERKGWAQEALAYNALVVEWPAITNEAKALAGERIEQQRF